MVELGREINLIDEVSGYDDRIIILVILDYLATILFLSYLHHVFVVYGVLKPYYDSL